MPDSPLILEIRARLDELEKEIAHHRETLAYLCGDGPESVATAMQAALDTLKRHKPS